MPKQKLSLKILTCFLLIGLLFSFSANNNGIAYASPEKKTAAKPARIASQFEAGGNYIEGEVIAEVQPDAVIGQIIEGKNLSASPIENGNGKNLYLLRSLNGKSTSKIIKSLQNNPSVISLQPNFKYKTLDRIPNDVYRSNQWALSNTTATPGGVSAFSAWDGESKRQTNIIVAVIDTGASFDHQDLRDNLTGGGTKGKNFSNLKKKPIDTDGHGSFLSGIIAAKTNNKRGVAGSSFFNHLRVMALKFDFTTSQAITAINYAKAKKVPVINASWGIYGQEGSDQALKDTIAAYPGIFVTASGNGDTTIDRGYNHDGGNPNEKMYPCDFELDNIICVGASDKNGNLTDYSDYGKLSVDVVAPGGTDDDPITGLSYKNKKYTYAEGSSLSTAFTSAEAGLILSKYPNLSTAQVIEIIKNSVDIEPRLQDKILTGGKINFQQALQLAGNY
jgi:hypothetical protein